MKVWNCGKFENVEIGQKVLIAHCGSGHTYFGEFGKLVKVTSQHLVFKTESGAFVKTAADNLHQVVGKAKKEGYFVSLKTEGREDDKNFIRQDVRFWDEKKLCFVNK
uniref:HNH endonuclease n=1 Tax=Dulem virus 37 TaxID=3145755 RepID=A0AAU8AWA9_9CAUD